MNTNITKSLFFVLVCLGLASCSGGLMISRKPLQITASTSTCLASESAYYYDSLVAASARNFKYDTSGCGEVIRNRFSRRATNIAKDIGVYGLLCQYARLEAKTTKSNDPELFAAKYELEQRIGVASSDVTSILAEIDCEKSRISEVESHLDEWIDARINRFTVASILAGSISAIATSAIALDRPDDSNTEQQYTAISGAVVSGYLGLRAVSVKKKIKLMHARNHLRDFLENPKESRLYAPNIWNFIVKDFTIKDKKTTGRQEVLNRWAILGFFDPQDKDYERKRKLLMSDGGDYEIDDLVARTAMLDVVAAEIDLIKYDIKRLQQEILLGKKL